MFNSAFPENALSPWRPQSDLESKDAKEASFHAMDWDALPRVSYNATKFRQLTLPEPAHVLDEVSEFVPTAYGTQNESPLPDVAQVAGEALDLQDSLEVCQGAEGGLDLGEAVLEPQVPSDEAGEPKSQKEDTAEFSESSDNEKVGCEDAPDDAQGDLVPAPDDADSLLAQSLIDEQMLAQASEDAYQKGLQAGREEMHLQMQEALRQAEQDSEQAKLDALAQQEMQLKQGIDTDKALLREVTQRLDACLENATQFFEPLKRLSMHIAEQLVLAELNVSASAIERLVQRCLDELNLHGNQAVIVELNPLDKSRLQEMGGEMFQHIQLQAVSSLHSGSVRVIVDDTQVEDLIQNRLEALAHSLLGQPEVWREKSPFFRQPLASRETDIQDVDQRPLLADPDDRSALDA